MTAGVSVRVLFLISNIYYPLHIPAGKIQDRSIHRKCGDVSKAGNRLRSAKVDKSIASAAALVLISPNFPKYRRSSHFLHSNPLLVVLKCFVVLCRLQSCKMDLFLCVSMQVSRHLNKQIPNKGLSLLLVAELYIYIYVKIYLLINFVSLDLTRNVII